MGLTKVDVPAKGMASQCEPVRITPSLDSLPSQRPKMLPMASSLGAHAACGKGWERCGGKVQGRDGAAFGLLAVHAHRIFSFVSRMRFLTKLRQESGRMWAGVRGKAVQQLAQPSPWRPCSGLLSRQHVIGREEDASDGWVFVV